MNKSELATLAEQYVTLYQSSNEMVMVTFEEWLELEGYDLSNETPTTLDDAFFKALAKKAR